MIHSSCNSIRSFCHSTLCAYVYVCVLFRRPPSWYACITSAHQRPSRTSSCTTLYKRNPVQTVERDCTTTACRIPRTASGRGDSGNERGPCQHASQTGRSVSTRNWPPAMSSGRFLLPDCWKGFLGSRAHVTTILVYVRTS